MEIRLSEDKLKRIKKALTDSEFKTVDKFVDHAIDLLLFAEENKKQFAEFLDKEE
jgi:hypothetical protein